MEIREFAEKILFSANLEDKFVQASDLTDSAPVFVGELPIKPQRSSRHSLSLNKESTGFPKLRELENPQHVARAMHYFANHELLALEIMALCLLKFPNAPHAFRRGIVKAMGEEQEHMRLYVTKMNELGLSFGEIEQNDYFWRSMADMKSELDFCVKMSMTFEQANLDFSKYYLNLFEELQDTNTSEILRQVYEDEISHVGFGLHWFKKWNKEAEGNLFLAHKDSLPFPLGLQRAKAGDKYLFDIEGRKKAGFDESYIDELFLFSASKERPSVVRYFNPHSEDEICDGKRSFTPDKNSRSLQSSLQHFLSLTSLHQDIVLCTQRPSHFYLKNLKAAKINIPEFLELTDFKALSVYRALKARKIERIEAWSESISTQETIEQCRKLYREPEHIRKLSLQDLREMNSQVYSLNLAKDFYDSYPIYQKILSPRFDLAKSFHEESLAKKHIETIEKDFVIKAEFGLSGRGVHFFSRDQKAEAKICVDNLFKKQKSILIETKYSREMDFSLQIDMSKDKKSCLAGFSRFLVSSKGKYLGGLLGRNLLLESSEKVRRFWTNEGRQPNLFEACLQDLSGFLYDKYSEKNYTGILGVDCFLCDIDGEIRLRAIVEINPRCNMGWLNHCLHSKIHPKSLGLWRVIAKREVKAIGSWSEEGLRDFCSLHPLELERGLWRRGVVFCSDPLAHGDFVAIVSIADSIADCEAILGLS